MSVRLRGCIHGIGGGCTMCFGGGIVSCGEEGVSVPLNVLIDDDG